MMMPMWRTAWVGIILSHTHNRTQERERERCKGIVRQPKHTNIETHSFRITNSTFLTYQRIIHGNQCNCHILKCGSDSSNFIQHVTESKMSINSNHLAYLVMAKFYVAKRNILKRSLGCVVLLGAWQHADLFNKNKTTFRAHGKRGTLLLCVTTNSMSESRREKVFFFLFGNGSRPVKNIKIRSRKVQASLTASSKNIC